jgi:2-succinyl-6-hydroxy-2,4-cyclohexadiene-1-carboxylate synthase
MTRIPINGIHLNVGDKGGEGPALLLLHGFTGDVSTWEAFLDTWSQFRLLRVDIIGHGKSDSPPDAARYTMEHAVADLLAVLDHLGFEQTAVLGYSMGGRLALHLALAAPQRISALLLESASPGIEDPAGREARRRSDAALADDIERDGMEAFVARWEAQPLFASQARLPAAVLERQRRQRLSQNPRGLANSLRGMGAGSQDFLLPRLGVLAIRSFFLAGALDERYVTEATRLAATVPGATLQIIPDAGHATHLEKPAVFAEAVRRFLVQEQGTGNKEHAARSALFHVPGSLFPDR